jgi:DNA-binding transcriptional regulator/RsmH inhibitor MraZ
VVEFCGQDPCTVDGNARLKFSPHFLEDFKRHGADVVLHCLPEGALAVYPIEVWRQMRSAEAHAAPEAAQSVVQRRRMRRFGALSQVQQLSNQGRVTIPAHFRDVTGLAPGSEAVLVGCEIGVEIWQIDAWKREFATLREHEQRRAEAEMAADLVEPSR